MTLLSRIQALIERIATRGWADTADGTEARALLELLKGKAGDAS